MANRPASEDRALMMGPVHEVFSDDMFEQNVTDLCRHLAEQHREQMGTAKLAIEIVSDTGLDQARHVECMANSALMLNPDHIDHVERQKKVLARKKGLLTASLSISIMHA